jgi:membrane associated rhomboid family serine protease
VALPLYDNQPTRRVPVVTYALVALNVVIFLITPMAALTHQDDPVPTRVCAVKTFSAHYAAIPKELTTNDQLPLSRDLVAECHPEPFTKTPWLSALTSMFLHGDWWHLLSNMVFLFVFGAATENRFGRGRFLLFYLACGFIAAYGFAFTYPDSVVPLVGASGAIAGVLGSHFVLYPRSRVILLIPPVRLPAWLVLGQFFVVQWFSLAAQSESKTAFAAHIYGFIAGMAVGLLARRARVTRRAAALTGR